VEAGNGEEERNKIHVCVFFFLILLVFPHGKKNSSPLKLKVTIGMIDQIKKSAESCLDFFKFDLFDLMSTGYPVDDHHHQNYPPQRQIIVIDSDQKMRNEYDDVGDEYEEDIPVHAEGLHNATMGEQTMQIVARICAAPTELQSNDGTLNVFRLSTEMVKSMKLPNTLTDKNGVALDKRTGNPQKTVFRKVVVTGIKNTLGFPILADIDGLKKTLPGKTGPSNLYLSAGVNDMNMDKDISEPNSVVTERMLLLHDPLLAVEREITESKDEDDEYWGLKAREKSGDITFTAALLVDMCNAKKFPKLNIMTHLADPANVKLDVPKTVLKRVRDEAQEASKQIHDSLINMFEWNVTFRRADCKSFIDNNAPVNGQYIGTSAEKIVETNNSINSVRGEVEVHLDVTYGMLDD